MARIVILGGGISGLLAAYVLRKHKPLLVEAQKTLGGNYTAGGLKYIRLTTAMNSLMAELGLPWERHKPIGLMFRGGLWHAHPGWLSKQTVEERRGIQLEHWIKTRGTTVGMREDCMNDPLGNGADVAMKCDHVELIKRLADRAREDGAKLITEATISRLSCNSIRVNSDDLDECQSYTHLVVTLPLGVTSMLAPWAQLPSVRARPLNIVDMETVGDAEPSWDYMYTPDTPLVSRITWQGSNRFQAEIPGDFGGAQEKQSIANGTAHLCMKPLGPFIPDAEYGLEPTGHRVIPGHLEPLSESIKWPESWTPLGRFSEWEPRATAERVLDKAIQLEASL